MPRAVAVGLPEPALQTSASPWDTNHISVMRRADLAGDQLLP